MLDLTPYLDRKPKQLSGGQRQRVAMGRAIVREPQVFLMDEPLSNLDAKLRVQMRAEIAKLQHELGTTTIYVTHDQVEAMTMGDRVAVMQPGRAPAGRRAAAALRRAGEPLRRGLHRHAADEPLRGRRPVARGHGRRVSLGGQELAVPDEALERYRALASTTAARSSSGIRSEDLHPARARPELPAITARLELDRGARLGDDGVLQDRRPHDPRRRGCDRRRRRGGRRRGGRSPRRGRTSSPRSRRGVALRLGDDVADRRRRRARSTSSTRRRVQRSVDARDGPRGRPDLALACIARRGRGRRHRRRGARTHGRAARRRASSRRCPRLRRARPLASQRIYFVMTDRYANGDPSNDRGGSDGRARA